MNATEFARARRAHMRGYVVGDFEPTQAERERAIANRERIRRVFERHKCDTCRLYTCQCEELTNPNNHEENT